MTMLSELVAKTEVGWTSYSGLTLHRSCPQKWSYKQLLRLERPPADDPAPALRFGTWWHALRAAEAIERGRRLGTILFEPKEIKCADDGPRVPTHTHSDVDCEERAKCSHHRTPEHWVRVENLVERVMHAAEQWEEAMPEDHAEQWQKKLGTKSVSRLLRNLDQRYMTHHAEDLDNEEPIGVEVKWTRQLPGSDTVLLGYTDEVYRDKKRGLIVVRDHKTSGRMGVMSTADDLLNSQLHLNAWGLKDRCEEWGVGLPNAISFERVKNTMPTKPKLTQAGRLSKTVFLFDLPTYMEFCESDEAKAAGYKPEQEQIERITAPAYLTQWFQRTLTPINRNIAKAHLQAAVDTNMDAQQTIQRFTKRGAAPRNFTGAACDYCEFAKLCRAQMIGGADGEYDLAEYGLRVIGGKP